MMDEEIRALIKDNQTWNTCPYCSKVWKDEIPIPGLLHRTRICNPCLTRRKRENDKKFRSDKTLD